MWTQDIEALDQFEENMLKNGETLHDLELGIVENDHPYPADTNSYNCLRRINTSSVKRFVIRTSNSNLIDLTLRMPFKCGQKRRAYNDNFDVTYHDERVNIIMKTVDALELDDNKWVQLQFKKFHIIFQFEGIHLVKKLGSIQASRLSIPKLGEVQELGGIAYIWPHFTIL